MKTINNFLLNMVLVCTALPVTSAFSGFRCIEDSLYSDYYDPRGVQKLVGPLKKFNYSWQCNDAIESSNESFLCSDGELFTIHVKEPIKRFNYSWKCTDVLKTTQFKTVCIDESSFYKAGGYFLYKAGFKQAIKEFDYSWKCTDAQSVYGDHN